MCSNELHGIAYAARRDLEDVEALTTGLKESRARAAPANGPMHSSIWGWQTSSRFCPRCLAESGGRWRLDWRLNWLVACREHRTLLTDTCPVCGESQRQQFHPRNLVPHPGHCARRQKAAAGSVRLCDADLTAANPNTVLLVRDSFLPVQDQILDLLAARPSHLSLYGSAEPAPVEVLSDIKSIAWWAISTIDYVRLEGRMLPIDIDIPSQPPDPARPPRADSTPTVQRIATGIAVAAAVLSRPDTWSAAALLAQLTITSTGDAGRQLINLPRNTLTAAPRAARDEACRQMNPRAARRVGRTKARR